MQNSINQIPVKHQRFKNLKIEHIIVEKQIYQQGEHCDVKFVRIDQPNPTNPILPPQLNKTKYAMKVILKNRINHSPSKYTIEYDAVYNQILALYLMDHPNVIKLVWHFQDATALYLLMEYGGTRLQAYARKHNLTEEQIKHLFSQICSGVHQIHSKSIMHRDLCLENILISSINNNLVKIIDFDHAIEYTGGRESAQGFINAMAPEIYHQKRYNNKADIWSLGIILYELFHKRNPFVDEEASFIEGEFVQRRDKLEYSIRQTSITDEAKTLIQRMLSLNPQKRPSIEQILSSKWITGIEPQVNHPDIHSSDYKKTMQIPNKQRKSISAFSISDQGDLPATKYHERQRISMKQDDFVFDKLINKMTPENTLQQLQGRLRKLLKIKTDEMQKKKQLTLKYMAVQKNKIQQYQRLLNQ